MNPNNASRQTSGKVLAARRLTLLASVAGIGLAVMFGGPGYGAPTPAAAPAQTAETVQHPAGVADLVAKVKPAVVSVRVKIDRTNLSMNENGSSNENSGDKTQFDQFFRQFGFENGQGAMQPRHQVITGEGSGFFITADGYAVRSTTVFEL